VLVGSLGQPPRPCVGDAQLAQGGRLAFEPAGLLVQGQRPRVAVDGLPVPAEAQVEVGQAELGGALGSCPALGFGGGQRRLRHRRPVDDMHALPEVAVQGVGQEPCRRSGSMLGGVLDGGDQVRSFGVQPSQRLGAVAERRDRQLATRRREREPHHVRVQQLGGGGGGVQVPVQQPPQRRLPLGLAVLGLGAPAGVQARSRSWSP
jgi:hypothetical protein